ncbi:unknown [Bacteroides sp. CAG:714]|nr:unknown [Bacteroides sp. CAG:714]
MIKIFIESGVNAAQKKGSKRTTNEQNFVETLVAHYFPHAVLGTDYLVVGVNGKDQLPNTQPVFVDPSIMRGWHNTME